MDGITITNSIVGAVPILLVPPALRAVSEREVARFSRRYSLPGRIRSTDLERVIARSRGMRLLGAAVGCSLSALVPALTHDAVGTGNVVLWAAVGYLSGALLAAVLPVCTSDRPLRSATLVPRLVADYLSPFTRALPSITVILCLVPAAAYFLLPRRNDEDLGLMVGIVALSVLVALVTVVAGRWVVRRPQPVADSETLAIDEAMRTHGLHLVFGAGNAIGALAASAASFQVGMASDVQPFRWVFPWIGFAELVLAWSAWSLRKDAWKVPPKVPV